jgi:hypothetical protein
MRAIFLVLVFVLFITLCVLYNVGALDAEIRECQRLHQEIIDQEESSTLGLGMAIGDDDDTSDLEDDVRGDQSFSHTTVQRPLGTFGVSAARATPVSVSVGGPSFSSSSSSSSSSAAAPAAAPSVARASNMTAAPSASSDAGLSRPKTKNSGSAARGSFARSMETAMSKASASSDIMMMMMLQQQQDREDRRLAEAAERRREAEERRQDRVIYLTLIQRLFGGGESLKRPREEDEEDDGQL